MKKRMLVLALSVVLICTLAACGCKHQWMEATCAAPKTCTACGATEGEALGHDFAPASCSVPETCTRCGEIGAESLGHEFLPATCETSEVCIHCGKEQGEALGHTYSKWVIAEDAQTMSRQCTVCHSEENLPVDYSRILKDELQGHWDLDSFSNGSNSMNARYLNYDVLGMYLRFREGNHADFYVDQEGYPKDVTWEFVEYQVIEDVPSYYFRIVGDGGISLMAVYLPQPNNGDDVIVIFDGSWRYALTHDTVISQAIEGTWADIRDGQLYTAKFSSDRTFTGNFGGPVSGTWHLRPIYYENSGDNDYRYCEILLRYTKDGSTQIAWGTIDLGTKDVSLEEYLKTGYMRIPIYFQGFSLYMERTTEEALTTLETAIAEGKRALIGPWTSTRIVTQYDNSYSEVLATDYSFTFAEDGTFTAALDQERSGTWRFDSADTRNSGNQYNYYFTFNGVENAVYSEISNDTLSITRFDNETITTIHFQQMTEEKIAQWEAQQQEAMAQIKGDWTSYLLSEYHYDDDNSSLHRSTLNCTLQIREDGTFTAKLDQERSGIWAFREILTYGDQDYVHKTYCYSLQLEGMKESFQVYINSDRTLQIQLPIENGSKSLSFRQMTANDLEATMQRLRKKVVGTWTAVSAHTRDYNTQTDTPMTDCDYTITIREDGTYTAQFSRPVSDVWYIDFSANGTCLVLCEGNSSSWHLMDGDGLLGIWHNLNDHVSVEVKMKKNG